MEESACNFIVECLGPDPKKPEAIVRCLLQWARENKRILPENWNRELTWADRGREHHIWVDRQSTRVYKSTYGRRFGLGFSRAEDANALEYLTRIRLCNALFNTELRFEGVWPYQNEVRIVTSQRFIRGDNTPQEKVTEFMEARQFERRWIATRLVYYRSSDNLVVADLHEQNVLTTRSGALVPIDVIIGKPGADLEAALLNPE